MSFVKRLVSRSRVREARRRLANEPTAAAYVQLAKAHAHADELDEALRVCVEGLEFFVGNPDLIRLARRARQLQMEDRTRQLSRELREAPRPALYRELCEILLESGQLGRAEEVSVEWFNVTQDGIAQLLRARARMERFFMDRRREDGRVALELCNAAEQLLPRESGPLQLRLQLCLRLGAWDEARSAVMRLLELTPGDPALEARFRTLSTMAADSPTITQALRQVERTGALVGDDSERGETSIDSRSIRPMLKELMGLDGVHAAVYERGSTALVQGTKGATAERTARAVREVVKQSRTAARRLGLGQAREVVIEGPFGSLVVAPGELASAALWCTAPVREHHIRGVVELASSEAIQPEEQG